MFVFSLSWDWRVFLGTSALQFYSYHGGFTLLSFIRHLCIFYRKGTYWNWCLCVFADVVPGHTTLGLTTCAPGVQQWTDIGKGHSELGPSPFWGISGRNALVSATFMSPLRGGRWPSRGAVKAQLACAGHTTSVTAQIQLWQQGKEHTLWWESQTGTPTLEPNICFPWSAQTAHGSAILKRGALQIKTDQFCSTILN